MGFFTGVGAIVILPNASKWPQIYVLINSNQNIVGCTHFKYQLLSPEATKFYSYVSYVTLIQQATVE